MSSQTYFLSRLLGLYCLIMGLVMIARPQATVQSVIMLLDDRPLLYFLGVTLLFGGLAMILVHNIWQGGAVAVTVTVIGWLTLLKGVLLVSLAPASLTDLYLRQVRYEQLYPLYALLTLGLGAYLTWAGFRSARPKR